MDNLPTKEDIAPVPEDLDEQTALDNFGGKTILEAEALFFQAPDYYCEDLAFMGPKAFAFYFRAVEPYIRSPQSKANSSFISWLHCVITSRLQRTTEPLPIECLADMVRISAYVLKNSKKFKISDGEEEKYHQLVIKLQLLYKACKGGLDKPKLKIKPKIKQARK